MTANVRDMLKILHPRHIYITHGALKSAPNNVQQEYHTDYNIVCPAHEMPFSVIITFTDQCFFMYDDTFLKERVRLCVPSFSFVRFMGNVTHSGGDNPLDRSVYRLFMYCAATPAHIPVNSFFLESKKMQNKNLN